MARALTIKALAAGCKVSTRTINEWLARGCPRTSIAEALDWQADHVQPRKGGPRTRREPSGDRRQRSLQERTLRANARKAEQDARYRKIKADRAAKKSLDRDQVVREAAELFTEMRAIIDSIPDAAAKEVPQQFRARVYEAERAKVDAALKKLVGLHLVGSADDDGS